MVFLPATLLTPPERMDHLERYYDMTRPLGWWGPVHREAARRGLVERTATRGAGPRPGAAGAGRRPVGSRRPLIRRSWTPEDAEGWSREDWIAILLAPIVYALTMLGVALALLGRGGGLAMLAAAVLCTGALYWVIDPKLRAISAEYEARQASYLRDLERVLRWQEPVGEPARPADPRAPGGGD
ncbi:MAG: hypothetical protein P8177_04580 [Gemmatimonadota bacterium]